jgi:hypothetical protein
MFATLSAFTRMFPTPPPSRRKRVPAEEYKAHQARKEERRSRHAHLHHHHHHKTANIDGHNVDQATTAQSRQHEGPESTSTGSTAPGIKPSSSSTAGPAGFSQSTSVRASAAPGLGPQQQSLEMALSGASSVPVMFDEAPGWGKDQGLSDV